MQLIPGGGDVGDVALPFFKGGTKAAKKGVDETVKVVAPKPLAEPIPAPPPPPTRQDPQIAEARSKQRAEDLRRRGRRASILTSARGVQEELGTVNRPRAAQLLGE